MSPLEAACPFAPPVRSARSRRRRSSARVAPVLCTMFALAGFGAPTRADTPPQSLNGFGGVMEEVLPLSPAGDPEPLYLTVAMPDGVMAEPRDAGRFDARAGVPWVARWTYQSDVRSGGVFNDATLHLVPMPDAAKTSDAAVREVVQQLVDGLVASGWTILIPLREMAFRSRARVRNTTVRTYGGEFAAKDGRTISGATGKNERANYLVFAVATPRTVVLLLCENDEAASKFTESLRVVPAVRTSAEPGRARLSFSNADGDRSLRFGLTVPAGLAMHHPRAAESGTVSMAPEAAQPAFEWRRVAGTDAGEARLTLDDVPAPLGFDAEWAAWLAERAADFPSPVDGKPQRAGDLTVRRASGAGGGVAGRTVFELAAISVGGRLYVLTLEEDALPAADPEGVAARKRTRAAMDLILARLGVILTEPFRKPSTSK